MDNIHSYNGLSNSYRFMKKGLKFSAAPEPQIKVTQFTRQKLAKLTITSGCQFNSTKKHRAK